MQPMKSPRACALLLCLLFGTFVPTTALKPFVPQSLSALSVASATIMDDTSNGAGGGGHTGG
jgi:hypothetical protein